MERLDRQDGMTLIEVSIAMATVAIISFGVLLGFSTASAQDRQAFEVTRSQHTAIAMLEQVEATPYEDLFAVAGIPFQVVLGKYTYDVQVTQIQADLLALEVICRSTADGSYSIRLVTMKTLKEELF